MVVVVDTGQVTHNSLFFSLFLSLSFSVRAVSTTNEWAKLKKTERETAQQIGLWEEEDGCGN